jgi:hypothetical protein
MKGGRWDRYKNYSLHSDTIDESIDSVVCAEKRTLEEFLNAVQTALEDHYDADVTLSEHDLLDDDFRETRYIQIAVATHGGFKIKDRIILTPIWIY